MSKKVKGQKLTLGAALDKFGGSEDPIPSGPSRGGDRWERGRDPEQDRSWNRRDRDDDFGDRPRRFRDDDGPSRADESSAWRREGGSRPAGRSEFSSRSDRYSRPFDGRGRFGESEGRGRFGDSEGRGRFGDSPERRWRDGRDGRDDYPPRRRYDDRDRDDRPRYNDRPRYSDRGRDSYSRPRDDEEERPAHLRRGIKKSSEESGLTSDDFPDPSASRPKEKSVSPSRKSKPTPKPAQPALKDSEDDPFGGAKPVGPGKLEPVRGGQLKRGSSPGASSRSPPVASRRGRDDDRDERGRGNTSRRHDDRRSGERREDSGDRGDSRKSSPRRGGPRGRGKDSEGSEGEEESPQNKKIVSGKSEKKQPSLAKLIREKSAVTIDQLTGSLSQLNINREGKDLSVSLNKSLLNGKVTIKSLLEILEKEKLDAKDQSEILVSTLKLVKKNKDASFVEDLIAKSSSKADVVAVIAQAVISPPKKGKKVDKEEEKKKIAEHIKNQDLEFLVSEEEEKEEEEKEEEKEENDEEDAENDDEDGGKEEDDELDPEEDILSHKAKYVPKPKQQQPAPAKPVSKEKEKSSSSKTSSKSSQPPKEDTSSRKTKKDVEALFPGRATVSSVKAEQEEEDKRNKKTSNVVSDKIVKEVKAALTNKTPSEVSAIVKEATGDLTPLLDPIAHALYQQLLTKPTPQQLAALAERDRAEKAAEKAKQKAKEKKEKEKDKDKTKGKGKEQEKEKTKKKVVVKEEDDEEEEGDNDEEADEEEGEDEKPKKKSKDEEDDEEDDEENDKKKKVKKDAKEAAKTKGDKDVPAASSTSTGGPNISVISDWSGLLKLVLTGVEAEHNFLTLLQNAWFESVQKNDTFKAYIKNIFEELFKQRIISVPALVAWKEKADKSKAKVQTLIKVNTWLTAVTEPVKESEEADEEEADEEEEDAYLQNPNKEFLT